LGAYQRIIEDFAGKPIPGKIRHFYMNSARKFADVSYTDFLIDKMWIKEYKNQQ